jgi:hypothetical protein
MKALSKAGINDLLENRNTDFESWEAKKIKILA